MKLEEFLEKVNGREQDIINYSEKEAFEAVRQDGYALQYVKDQTPELCLEAVKQDGYALRYVKDQTPELCLEAVRQNGQALQYVKDQTPELCLEAVRQNGNVLQYVNKSIFEEEEDKVFRYEKALKEILSLLTNWKVRDIDKAFFIAKNALTEEIGEKG